MGVKELGIAALLGAGALYYFNTGVNPSVNSQVESNVSSYISSANDATGRYFNNLKPAPKKPSGLLEVISNFIGVQDTACEDPLLRPNGTRVQKGEIYHGSTWPEEWPKRNPDGTFDRDYVDYLIRQNK